MCWQNKLLFYVTILRSLKYFFVPKLSASPIYYDYQQENERNSLKLRKEMQIKYALWC